jgi:hypothetical protein
MVTFEPLPFMKYYALIILCSCLVGCDSAYPPVIVNAYAQPIEISVSFTGGIPPETGIRLASMTEFVQRRKGLKIEEITVKEQSGKLHFYRSADFEGARSERKPNFEVWILSANGLKLGDKEDLRKLMAERR